MWLKINVIKYFWSHEIDLGSIFQCTGFWISITNFRNVPWSKEYYSWNMRNQFWGSIQLISVLTSFQSCLNWCFPILPFFVKIEEYIKHPKQTWTLPLKNWCSRELPSHQILSDMFKPDLGSPLLNESHRCLVAEILSNLISHLTISSQIKLSLYNCTWFDNELRQIGLNKSSIIIYKCCEQE